MINLKVNDADRILIVEMTGMISEADIDGAIDTFIGAGASARSPATMRASSSSASERASAWALRRA